MSEEPHVLGVSVITPKGLYPNNEDYRRVHSNEKIQALLDLVKEEQKITNTDGWVVTVGERDVNPAKTFKKKT